MAGHLLARASERPERPGPLVVGPQQARKAQEL